MNKNEPMFIKRLIMKFVFSVFKKSIYKEFVYRIPLVGNEEVLDYGCGMGSIAYYTLMRLTSGNLTCLVNSKRQYKSCQRNFRKFKNIKVLYAQDLDLPKENYDVIYCHFTLHKLSKNDLKMVIPNLIESLQTNGYLIFKEPINDLEKIKIIKNIFLNSELSLISSRVTDLSFIGNALESVYRK